MKNVYSLWRTIDKRINIWFDILKDWFVLLGLQFLNSFHNNIQMYERAPQRNAKPFDS